MELEDWRARIDSVDRKLVDLLNERMECARAIGEIKRAAGREIRDEKRERAILQALKDYNEGPFSDRAIEEVFERIMQEARELEKF